MRSYSLVTLKSFFLMLLFNCVRTQPSLRVSMAYKVMRDDPKVDSIYRFDTNACIPSPKDECADFYSNNDRYDGGGGLMGAAGFGNDKAFAEKVEKAQGIAVSDSSGNVRGGGNGGGYGKAATGNGTTRNGQRPSPPHRSSLRTSSHQAVPTTSNVGYARTVSESVKSRPAPAFPSPSASAVPAASDNVKEKVLQRKAKVAKRTRVSPKRWSKEADDHLRNLKVLHPDWSWKHLGESMKLNGYDKGGKQVRERWMNHLMPGTVKGGWTEEEDLQLIRYQSDMGNCWSAIAKLLPGRYVRVLNPRKKRKKLKKKM